MKILSFKNFLRLWADPSGSLKLGPLGTGVVILAILLAIIVPPVAKYTNNWSSFSLFIALTVIPLFIVIHSFAAFVAQDDKDDKDDPDKKDPKDKGHSDSH